MEEQNMNNRPENPRRKKRSKAQIIKENYLPALIVCVSLVLIIIFAIGSIVRSVQKNRYNAELAKQESIAAQQAQDRLNNEAAALLNEAVSLAKHFDYAGAIAVLDSFSGNLYEYAELSEKYAEYASAQSNLVLWNDPNQVLNLSFQPLIADSKRAFTDETYGTSYYNNYITVDEFTKILLQLYENGYTLIRHSDVAADNGAMEVYLPTGKKPLIITETHVNYNTYMIDGDGDKLPDKDGSGFASKLIVDENGNLTCQYVDSTGVTTTGAYDIVPILESFVETHPDFSYKGAKAILALSGYDGLFGYRTTPAALEHFGSAFYDQQVQEVTEVIAAVKDAGYELACYSYENESYGGFSADQISQELALWNHEVTPLLGQTSLFVLCRNTDIAEPGTAYSGSKFEAMRSNGFTDFIGFAKEGKCWYNSYADHTRMGRILVTGANMANHSEWFTGIFDPGTVKDQARSN